MGKQWLPFNLNESIKVKLHPKGYEIMADDHNAFIGRIPNRERRTSAYYEAKADNEGYTRFQAWQFMELFGPHVGIGMMQPFDTNILVHL